MTTLNARANQAWRLKCEAEGWDPNPFYNQSEAYEEGWETGYKAACAEQDLRIDQAEAAAYDRGWRDAKEDGKP